jgi:glycosyltransferase involved in cell wall biosynthesis
LGTPISWLLPGQNSVERTLEALSRIRDLIRGEGAQIVLVDQPDLVGLSRHVSDDVLLVRTERRLSLARLLDAGLAAAEDDIIVWCPSADQIPAGDLSHSIDFVRRHDAIVLATRPKTVDDVARTSLNQESGSNALESASAFNRLRFRLCRECFVARRKTAQRVAAKLRVWGDSPVSTAAILAAMRLPVRYDRGLTSLKAVSSAFRVESRETGELRPMERATRHRHRGEPFVSVIITAHNEGPELRRTIDSVEANTSSPIEFIIVDDGSSDGSCQNLAGERLRVIRNNQRVGVAFSRNAGAQFSRGNVLLFLDGHQRVSSGCLERCATVALANEAIVWPDVRTLHNRSAIGHGAFFRLQAGANPLTAKWNNRRPGDAITKISSLRAPGYFVPRKLFDELRWISQLRGWGASEAAIALKAFFLGIDILHVCGPVARHLFRPTFRYAVSDEEVSRNHALITRVCFDDRTWYEHWWPRVFEKCLSSASIRDLESAEVLAEHEEFLKRKLRTDREFWRGLLGQPEPDSSRQTAHKSAAHFVVGNPP